MGTCRTSQSAPGAPPRAKAKQHPHAQWGRCHDPSPLRRGMCSGHAKPGKATRECPLHHSDHRCDAEVGPGATSLPFHTPLSDGEERRGAHRQSEKSSPIRQGMSVPHLARFRPSAGGYHVTTSIHRQKTEKGNGARTTLWNGPVLASASPRKTLPVQPLRGRGPRRDGAQDVQTSTHRPESPEGESQGFRITAKKLPGTPVPSSNHPRTVCPQ